MIDSREHVQYRVCTQQALNNMLCIVAIFARTLLAISQVLLFLSPKYCITNYLDNNYQD